MTKLVRIQKLKRHKHKVIEKGKIARKLKNILKTESKQ